MADAAFLLRFSALLVTVPLGSCTDAGFQCRAHDEESFHRVVQEEGCPGLWLYRSKLTTLDGLEQSPNVKRVIVEEDDQLTDLSAASGSESLRVWENATLSTPDVALRQSLSVTDTDVDSLTIQLTHTADPPGEAPSERNGQIMLGRGRFGEVTLGCDRACQPTVLLYEINEDVLFRAGGEVTRVALKIASEIVTHDFLHPLGVPRSVSFSSPQDLGVLRSYRSWLDEQGFAGTFELCDDNGCVEVEAEAP